ncbi:13335_t:CDS:2, partial [Gigaspora margarita]
AVCSTYFPFIIENNDDSSDSSDSSKNIIRNNNPTACNAPGFLAVQINILVSETNFIYSCWIQFQGLGLESVSGIQNTMIPIERSHGKNEMVDNFIKRKEVFVSADIPTCDSRKRKTF